MDDKAQTPIAIGIRKQPVTRENKDNHPSSNTEGTTIISRTGRVEESVVCRPSSVIFN